MKQKASIVLFLGAGLFMYYGCDSGSETVTKGREAVKEVVIQPFNALEDTKDTVTKGDRKTKAAVEELDKELK